MITATATASILFFLLAFQFSRLAGLGSDVIQLANSSIAAIRDDDIPDEEKASISRKASIKLLRVFFSILLRVFLCLLASFVPILVSDLGGQATITESLEFLSRWQTIVATTVLISLFYLVILKIRHSK